MIVPRGLLWLCKLYLFPSRASITDFTHRFATLRPEENAPVSGIRKSA
jgi:hypothetical protein